MGQIWDWSSYTKTEVSNDSSKINYLLVICIHLLIDLQKYILFIRSGGYYRNFDSNQTKSSKCQQK